MTISSGNTIDLNQQRLKMADDVRVWPVRERGEVVYRIEIPALHRFFRVGYRESFLCSLLDGNTTLAQACSIAAGRLVVRHRRLRKHLKLRVGYCRTKSPTWQMRALRCAIRAVRRASE